MRLWWRRRRTYTAALERELSRYRAKCARLEADLTLERSGRLADALALYELRVDDAKAVADAFARMTTRRPVHGEQTEAPPAQAESIHETADEAQQRARNARVNARVAYANKHSIDYGIVLEKIRSGELTTEQIMAEVGPGTAERVAYANKHSIDYGIVLEKIRSGELTTEQIMAEVGPGTAELIQ